MSRPGQSPVSSLPLVSVLLSLCAPLCRDLWVFCVAVLQNEDDEEVTINESLKQIKYSQPKYNCASSSISVSFNADAIFY